MKKAIKLTALLLTAAIVFALSACSGIKTEDFKAWFNDEFSPAYDAFVQTESGKNDAPSPDISLLITSDSYLNSVFDYIADGTQPENAEVTEANGVYTYKAETFSQAVELDEKTSSIKITMEMSLMGETRTNFIVVFSQRSGEYFIQYLAPEFSEYYEVRFTAEGGSVKHESKTDLPYTIFGEDIPDTFAKEN